MKRADRLRPALDRLLRPVGRLLRALRERLTAGRRRGLKALLAAAPLGGIDLARQRDLGRDVEL
ncbi:MAG TPA: hypothetical protein VGF60_23260 [Xanthobacteraceae bacterium]